MLRSKPQFKRSTCLTASLMIALSSFSNLSLAQTNQARTADTTAKRSGFNFSNPTTTGSNRLIGGEKINLGELVTGAADDGGIGGNDNSGDIGINLPGGTGGFPGSGGSSGGIPGFPGSSNIPSNNPYAPWSPYDSYGDNKPGMLAIPQSMVPGVVCPLVDNRPHPDIMQAINQLFQYVIPTGPCRSEKDQDRLAEIAKNMKESGIALKNLNSGINSGTIDAGSVNLPEIQGQIQTLVSGMDTLTTIVTSNPLSGNSRCGQAGLKGGELLKSMGNLVTSIAPYALLLASVGTGGTATPALAAGGAVAKPIMTSLAKPALKYLLGAFAVGSIANVYGDLIHNGSIDMNKPDQREALLQNLCEFFRIEQRVNYLKLADMGNIRNINERLKVANDKLMVFKQKTQMAMNKSYPKEILQLAQIEEDINGQLGSAQKSIRADKKEMQDINKILGTGNNSGAVCSLGRLLAKQANDTKSFPGRTIKNYQFILSKQTRVTTAQNMILQAEEDLRESLNNISKSSAATAQSQCAPGTQCLPFQQCAEVAKNYIANVQMMIADGDQKIGVLQSSLNSTLNENPDFREFKNTQAAVKREVLVRANTGRLIALLAGDNAATVREEIDRQMDLLKKTLFNNSSWFAHSPVGAWLESSSTEYRTGLKAYQNELERLYNYARKAAAPTRLDRGADIAKYNESMETLAMISSKFITPGSEASRPVCHSLTNLTLQWHTAINHLKAQKFFCDSIQPMMDIRVEKQIGNFCFGDVNPINGKVYKLSEVEQNLNVMGSKFGARARLIDSKYKDLQCEQKDATEVMN